VTDCEQGKGVNITLPAGITPVVNVLVILAMILLCDCASGGFVLFHFGIHLPHLAIASALCYSEMDCLWHYRRVIRAFAVFVEFNRLSSKSSADFAGSGNCAM
jgi:hypothetical protein